MNNFKIRGAELAESEAIDKIRGKIHELKNMSDKCAPKIGEVFVGDTYSLFQEVGEAYDYWEKCIRYLKSLKGETNNE